MALHGILPSSPLRTLAGGKVSRKEEDYSKDVGEIPQGFPGSAGVPAGFFGRRKTVPAGTPALPGGRNSKI
jgi:hypothetical protein